MLIEKGQGGFWWIVREPLQFLSGGLLLAMLVFGIAGIGDQAWKDAPGGYGPRDEALANWLVRPLPCGLTPEQRIYGLTSAIGEPVEINLKHLRNGILDGDPDRVGVDFMADSEGLSDAPGFANIRLDTGGGSDSSMVDTDTTRREHGTRTIRYDPQTHQPIEDLSYDVAVQRLTTGETPGYYMRLADAWWIVAFYRGGLSCDNMPTGPLQ